MKMRKTINLLMLASLFATPIHAADVGDIDWALSDNNVSQAIARLSRDSMPAEMTQLLRQTHIDIQEKTVTEQRKIINYFPRFVDAENYGSQSIFFNPQIESLRVTAAATMSPTGEIKQVDPDKVQVLETSAYNTFHSDKEVILVLPGLREGSFSIIEFELVTQRDAMESDWSRELYIHNNYPIEHFRLNVSWDEAQPFNWEVESASVQCEKSETSLLCSGDDLAAYKGDNQAYWRDHIDRISLGSLSNWNQVIDRANQLMVKAGKDKRGLSKLTAELSEGTDSIEQRVANILRFVSRDIRYVSMSEHGNAMTPHTLAETIENRFGDCKDKSALLKALLEEIGLQANLVLIATQRTDSRTMLVPTMNTYNHVVVCFRLGDEEYCVDPTDTQTNWQYTPAWIENKVALPLVSGYIPHALDSSPYRWRMSIDTDIVFNREGGQTENQQRIYYGQNAASFRSTLYPDTEEERQASLLKQYQKVVSDLAEPNFAIEYLENMSPELVITSEAELDPFLEMGKPLIYRENDAWIMDELSVLRLSNEHYSEHFPGLHVESAFSYDTKGLWRITDFPASLHFSHEFGYLTRDVVKESDSKFKVKTKLRIAAQKVKAKDIKRFNKLLSTYMKQSEIYFSGVSAM